MSELTTLCVHTTFCHSASHIIANTLCDADIAWLTYRYAAPVYCDIKHLVMVTEEDGSKAEESSVKHEKIFLGEVWTQTLACSFTLD